VLPDGLGARIDLASFPRPPVFKVLAALGPIDEHELRRTFNIGLGYVVIVAKSDAPRALELLRDAGEEPRVVGEIIDVDPATDFEARVEFV